MPLDGSQRRFVDLLLNFDVTTYSHILIASLQLDTLTEKKIDIISKMLKDKEKELKSSD